MANNNQQISSRKINKQIDNLNTTVDNLYNTVYSTRVDNQKDLDRITDNIDDNLNELLSSVNNQNVSNLSSLLIRLQRLITQLFFNEYKVSFFLPKNFINE